MKGRTQYTVLNSKSLTKEVINDRNGTIITYINNPIQNPWCDDECLTESYKCTSMNQALVGRANPKTFIKPVVIAPPPSLDFWKANNLINVSQINTESQFDTYLSGYDVSNCCDRIDVCVKPKLTDSDTDIIENFELDSKENYIYTKGYYEGISDKNHPVARIDTLKTCDPIISPTPATTLPKPVNSKEDYKPPHPLKKFFPIISPTPAVTSPTAEFVGGKYGIEGFEIKPLANESGWVNTSCGYNPEQLFTSGLPTNYSAGNCEKDPSMKQYNENLFTQNIGPDTYTRNQIIEPINANIGISFTQQFEPRTCDRDEKGLTYTEHDPRIAPPIPKIQARHATVTETNVYDPRFSGYGSSYRSYTDELTGQTRFYYDDINSVRMPNYVSRSNLDFAPYADSYGPLEDSNKTGNPFNSNIRALGQDTWLRSNIEQRDSLSSSLMRKRNSELWQNRMYPKYTM